MSFAALNYVTPLQKFPDGAPMDATDKSVALVLAHHHNPERCVTYPSAETIAREACASLSTVQRRLRGMERHFLIRRGRPGNQGRGQITTYRFLALDDPDQLRELLPGRKAGQVDTLLWAEKRVSEGGQIGEKRVSEGGQPDEKRVSEGGQTGTRNKEELRTDKKELEPPDPSNSESGPEGGTGEALSFARGVRERLALPTNLLLYQAIAEAIGDLAKDGRQSAQNAAEFLIARADLWRASSDFERAPGDRWLGWFRGQHYRDDPETWKAGKAGGRNGFRSTKEERIAQAREYLGTIPD